MTVRVELALWASGQHVTPFGGSPEMEPGNKPLTKICWEENVNGLAPQVKESALRFWSGLPCGRSNSWESCPGIAE